MTAPSIRITARVARRLLREVVAEAGRGHVIQDGCTYVGVVSAGPHCLVGRALHRAGVTENELYVMDHSSPTSIAGVEVPRRVRLTGPARRVLAQAQAWQDQGDSWGRALDAALAVRPWAAVA